jgi:hypothetical protein
MKRLHSSVAVQNNHSHLIHSSVIDWQSSRRPAVSLTVNVRKLKNRNFCKKHQHVQNTEINFELQKILNSSSSINVIEIFDEMSRGFREILYDILHLVLYLNFSFLWWMRLDEFWIKKYFNFKFCQFPHINRRWQQECSDFTMYSIPKQKYESRSNCSRNLTHCLALFKVFIYSK